MKTEGQFWLATGNWPVQDDMERVNCLEAGTLMHLSCGWCLVHDKPRSQCLECMKEAVALSKRYPGEVGVITQTMWDELKPSVANRQGKA